MTTTELLTIREELQSLKDLNIDLRGSGKSEFLYIRSLSRAAEISIENNKFFIEYWDVADEESDRTPVKSETVPSRSDALKRLAEWLE